MHVTGFALAGKPWFRRSLLGVCSAAVAALSLLPRATVEDLPPLFPHADAAAHVLMYAVLSFLALWNVAPAGRRGAAAVTVAVACALYGLALEGLQAALPIGRECSWLDAAANAAGASLGVCVLGLLSRNVPRRSGDVAGG